MSLVWNLGVVFNLILKKKNYFASVNEVMNKSREYKYENREMPEFKPIVEGMLQKEQERRINLEKVINMLVKEA